MTKRNFDPYELTQLARHGLDPSQISEDDTRPVEYITGWVDFSDLMFEVNQSVLIPRLETEYLVKMSRLFLENKLGKKSELSVIDVGTGSGAIIISLASLLSDYSSRLNFYATDISESALDVARKNARRILSGQNKVSFIHSDLLEEIPKTIKFDLIIANLPYIPSERINFLDPSVKNHEPKIALDGGIDGLALVRGLLEQAKSQLSPDGKIFLEIDHTHTKPSWEEFAGDWQVEIQVDQFSKNRFALISPR